MKILSMTANFGKLENARLQLQEGLHIQSAPNEWGKSTWCAFIMAMLYGIDTSARSKKAGLADKERYAPWSGAPMSGRMEILWRGKHITLERRPKGRTPMGDFSAYETETGLPVPELTAVNCGQVLLGVERSVFQRASFIQLSDLPVTEDESLRRRLNALVTTGDENDAGDALAQNLKDLKNRCRHNKTGLLPQAEAQEAELQRKLRQQAELETRILEIGRRQEDVDAYISQLQNHKIALQYASAQANRQTVLEAEAACRQAQEATASAQADCEGLLDPAEARQLQAEVNALTQAQFSLQAEPVPQPPQAPLPYGDVPPEQATAKAAEDLHRYLALNSAQHRTSLIAGIYLALSVLLLALLAVPRIRSLAWLVGSGIFLGGIGVLVLCMLRTRRLRDEIQKIFDRHPGQNPNLWMPEAETSQKAWTAYTEALAAYEAQCSDRLARQTALERRIRALGPSLPAAKDRADQSLAAHDHLGRCRQAQAMAEAHLQALQSVVKEAPMPTSPDTLTLSEAATEVHLAEAGSEKQALRQTLGNYQGQMDALGSPVELQAQLAAVQARIRNLTRTYNALELAISTLADATGELQRRFAPRIQQQAQDIFSHLTGGKYDRLTLSQDMAVQVGGAAETTLRPALWRSEGTVDQLYLSLRLAVARELTPQAPLILDDAFARFDDQRLARAMALLQQEAQTRQVILFTCQSREKDTIA